MFLFLLYIHVLNMWAFVGAGFSFWIVWIWAILNSFKVTFVSSQICLILGANTRKVENTWGIFLIVAIEVVALCKTTQTESNKMLLVCSFLSSKIF